jgi:hypothetical protein
VLQALNGQHQVALNPLALHVGHHLVGEVDEDADVIVAQPAWYLVGDGDRTEQVAVPGDEGDAAVGPQSEAGDDRAARERLDAGGILEDQRPAVLEHVVRQRILARQRIEFHAHEREGDDLVREHQRDRADRHVQPLGSELRQEVVGGVGACLQRSAGLQRR